VATPPNPLPPSPNTPYFARFLAAIIAALNTVNTPWIAIAVIILGMVFDIVCQKNNVSNDAATGVIGAGVGMLTSQGIHAVNALAQAQASPPNPPQPNSNGAQK